MKPSHLNSSRRTSSRRRKPTARRSQSRVRVRAKREEDADEKKSSSCGCYFFILIILAGLGFYAYQNKDQWIDRWNLDKYFKPQKKEVKKFTPDPEKYEHLKSHLAGERMVLRQKFIGAQTSQEQDEVINEACALLEDMMPQLMRCWLGHPWDFNGTATVPGKGKIACGYYVSVIMRDTGFKVKRINLAQQASQRIIKTFLPLKKDRWTTGGMPYDEYAGKLNSKYEGINIVGLDSHVAFVVVKNGEMRFIHSRGFQSVVDEGQSEAHSLKVSSYRVIGNLTRNRDLLQKWILDDPFDTAK